MSNRRNRRQYQRYETSKKAVFVVLDERLDLQRSLDAKLVDIGRGGACLRVPMMVHPGSHGVLLVMSDGDPLVNGVEVRSARYDSKRGGHLVGLRFWGKAPSKALADLVASIRKSVGQDAA